jgi:hypothetical protein
MQTFDATNIDKEYQFYDEEAARVSQKIDEELKVCTSFSSDLLGTLGHRDLQRDWVRRKDAQRRQVKGALCR